MQQNQDAYGFFTTKTRHAVSYQNLAVRQEVQNKLDHAVALLATSNVMAIFESFFPRKYWSPVLRSPASTTRLRALRHLRFAAIHGFTGLRPNENRRDFNRVMSSADPLPGVRSFTADRVELELESASHALAFTRRQYELAICRVERM